MILAMCVVAGIAVGVALIAIGSLLYLLYGVLFRGWYVE